MNPFSSVNTCPLQSLTASGGIPWWKRALDVLCVVLLLPLLALVGLVVAAVIKIVSPGPIFFRQERIGYRGRPFMCFKFRTMIVNADTDVHKGHLEELISSNLPMTKLDGDDRRVIPGGIWLRSLGLDELPQLINVLRGEMSLVGPRPCVSYEYEKYLPRHRIRCATLPGLTGLWQVNDKNNTTFEEMMDLDIYYVHNKSLWMDVSILARTFPAVLLQTREVRRKKRNASETVLVPGATAARAVRSPDQAS
ncbi:MAG TPA: sugar transferase [Verrucomicrobiae bacterium]|jgi:lipopolysaccharide/colanic/teichoic acid biosynthesis glycosyltransferase|nr:sugar transferase [Verrucomicrobiae bacterium]